MNNSTPICCPSPLKNEGRGLNVKDGDRVLAAMAKALGHPARVKIVRHLLKANACICGDIVAAVGLAQATVSQHLKVLKMAGIIRGTINGPATCYCVKKKALQNFRALLGEL